LPIAGGLDIHRKQITFDYLDTVTGEVKRGQVVPADREHLRAWLARFRRLRGCRVRGGGVRRVAACRRGAGRAPTLQALTAPDLRSGSLPVNDVAQRYQTSPGRGTTMLII
jgi:hypothetical protein